MVEDNTINDYALDARKKRKRRRIFSLLFVIASTLVVLIVSTYAWFIGVGVVATNTFTINIAPAKSLELSLDGENWFGQGETFTVTREGVLGTSTEDDVPNAYTGNTNHWADSSVDTSKGLNPVSTSGEVDSNVGRLVFYEKTSLTATKGGYRLIASKIDNYSVVSGTTIKDESDAYVAFDLFIRNGLESNYNPVYNALDNEAVYLTTDSTVVAQPSGSQTEDYGLANSVRIAFMQIGRVMSVGSTSSQITSIDCTTDTIPSGTTNYAGYNTGLCSVTPIIWEPNETAHNSNLITYFSSVCKTKSVVDSVVSYSTTPCTALVNGTRVNTYTINSNILSSDNVDIYDGHNGYSIPASYKLTLFDTFTDTEKNVSGQDRPTFFSLASNSVTKIRVYIYLEGQDVDNYDLISRGNTIKVNFGFTLDIFDIDDDDE